MRALWLFAPGFIRAGLVQHDGSSTAADCDPAVACSAVGTCETGGTGGKYLLTTNCYVATVAAACTSATACDVNGCYQDTAATPSNDGVIVTDGASVHSCLAGSVSTTAGVACVAGIKCDTTSGCYVATNSVENIGTLAGASTPWTCTVTVEDKCLSCQFAGVASSEENALSMLSGVDKDRVAIAGTQLQPCLHGSFSSQFNEAVMNQEISLLSDTTDSNCVAKFFLYEAKDIKRWVYGVERSTSSGAVSASQVMIYDCVSWRPYTTCYFFQLFFLSNLVDIVLVDIKISKNS